MPAFARFDPGLGLNRSRSWRCLSRSRLSLGDLAAFPLALASALAALAFLGAGSEGFAPAWLSAEVFAALATFSVTKASPN